MPTWTRIVILANSTKRNHRCVAGKVISWDAALWHVGGWIRPIDRSEKEGAVSFSVMRCEDGSFPDVLDIVDVPLIGPANDPNHPEDWELDTQFRWKRVAKFPATGLGLLADTAPVLWSDPRHDRKVASGYVSSMSNPASLCFMRPPLGWEFVKFRDTAWSGGMPTERTRMRSRLLFKIHDRPHAFDINDPHFDMRYGRDLVVPEYGRVVVTVPHPAKIYCCLSLTPAFNGWHYKVLAAVIEEAA